MNAEERIKLIDQIEEKMNIMTALVRAVKRTCVNTKTGLPFDSLKEILENATDQCLFDLRDNLISIGAMKADNSVEVKQWELWLEGYSATGQSVNAQFMGMYPGVTFADACDEWVKEDTSRKHCFNRNQLMYWGCRFFDNEAGARKAFG